jgi:hypothetical protein
MDRNQYMVEIGLPAFLSQAFVELIPQQREFINEMFDKGIITGYSLALDRSKVWVTFAATNAVEVEKVIKRFPVYHYIEYKVRELAFHESANTVIPAISLN